MPDSISSRTKSISDTAFPDEKTFISYYTNIADITRQDWLIGQLENINTINPETILKHYLNKTTPTFSGLHAEKLIFPFGSNNSQIKAVREALNNPVNIIEGPPGTGKTQTILNIIANLVIRHKTVAVVSNNNSATDNVFEKLTKYKYDYIAAQLGSRENREEFVKNKQTEYPDFKEDVLSSKSENKLLDNIYSLSNEINGIFRKQEWLAVLKCEYAALELEKKYFDAVFSPVDSPYISKKDDLESDTVLKLWNQLLDIEERDKKLSRFLFKIKCILFHHIHGIWDSDINRTIRLFQTEFYNLRLTELKDEIKYFEKEISNKAGPLTDELSQKSNIFFKSVLARKYNRRTSRRRFIESEMLRHKDEFLAEYPVILSTTHSIRSTLKNTVFDYVIFDESSQIDLVTGALAMSCAKNIVVVGDSKQLPNVITSADYKAITEISNRFNIPEQYRYEKNSLLDSISSIFADCPQTLLREHYRCHPKIIEFCNQKFYNNKLLIMTEDNGESDVIKAYVTVAGNHARGRVNRRQIDEIKEHILPELNSSDVGIISPYNDQNKNIEEAIGTDIDISTVHKFQGREHDDIIISTVDNEITDFTDNPNLLNVAVSRAKKRLRVVISDNEQNENTNVGDLVKYIQHSNFEVTKSDICSVFDMLYSCYEKERKAYLKKHKLVSEYDSENLMYSEIESVLSMDEFSKLGVVVHQPLNLLIHDFSRLSPEEARYAKNPLTHIDFLIYHKFDKLPVLAVEVDGYAFHDADVVQSRRDELKNSIFGKYQIPLIRFNTTGSKEREKLEKELRDDIACRKSNLSA